MTHAVPVKTWLTEPLSSEISQSVKRLCLAGDIQHVALMPDVHLAHEVCIGAVVATAERIYPSAVGGDIGCGMAALPFAVEAAVIDNEQAAARILAGLYEQVPANKHRRKQDLPRELPAHGLSNSRLQRLANREGRVQLGTLGRGNHFLEFQSDHEGRLWIMIHSGSRAMGQAIMAHYRKVSRPSASGLPWLHSRMGAGPLYLADVAWARRYARENRLCMLRAVGDIMRRLWGVTADWDALIHSDHNHVQQETHFGKTLWVHRKGAQSAAANELGIIPGSMGAASFHTMGRGAREALTSCSHGAGRQLTRTEARRQVSGKQFARQVAGLWYDQRRIAKLRDEAPSAYKDIRRVMQAQRELTRMVRELKPLLTYKGA